MKNLKKDGNMVTVHRSSINFLPNEWYVHFHSEHHIAVLFQEVPHNCLTDATVAQRGCSETGTQECNLRQGIVYH